MSESVNLKEIIHEPGVKDLPMKVKAFFARALRFERLGQHEDAEASLNTAIEKESEK